MPFCFCLTFAMKNNMKYDSNQLFLQHAAFNEKVALACDSNLCKFGCGKRYIWRAKTFGCMGRSLAIWYKTRIMGWEKLRTVVPKYQHGKVSNFYQKHIILLIQPRSMSARLCNSLVLLLWIHEYRMLHGYSNLGDRSFWLFHSREFIAHT